MRRLWLIALIALFPAAVASQSGWVTQNNAQTYITRNANNQYAVTITQQNTSACSLKLVSNATTALSVCGTSVTLPAGVLGALSYSTTASAGLRFYGTFAPTGQGRGILFDPTLTTEAGGAMLGLAVYPTITVPNGVATTSINGLEISVTYTGTPSVLDYSTALSVVDYVAPTGTTEASTVRIDNEPTGATRNWALLVGDGKNYFGGIRGHHFGNGTTDSATQLYLHTQNDTGSSRGLWLNSILNGMGNGDFGAQFLVDGTLVEPSSGAANGAGIRVNAPTITGAAGSFTTLSSFYVSGATSAATNNYSIFVDAGISRFDGQVQVAQGSASAPSIADQTASNRGVNFGSNQIELVNGGATKALLDNTGAVLEWRVGSAAAFAWSSNASPSAAGADTWAIRTAAGTIAASANGTTAGGTFTAANYTFAGTTGKTGTTCTAFTVGGCTTASEPDAAYFSAILAPSIADAGFVVLTAAEYADFQAMRSAWKSGARQ